MKLKLKYKKQYLTFDEYKQLVAEKEAINRLEFWE
jgi:hypothetical protein